MPNWIFKSSYRLFTCESTKVSNIKIDKCTKSLSIKSIKDKCCQKQCACINIKTKLTTKKIDHKSKRKVIHPQGLYFLSLHNILNSLGLAFLSPPQGVRCWVFVCFLTSHQRPNMSLNMVLNFSPGVSTGTKTHYWRGSLASQSQAQVPHNSLPCRPLVFSEKPGVKG